MKIFLGVILVVLLASVVQADLKDVLEAIIHCGQDNAGKASDSTSKIAKSKLSQLGAKCENNPAPSLVGLIQCSGADLLVLVGTLSTELPNAITSVLDDIPFIGGILGNIFNSILESVMEILTPPMKNIFELLATLLDIPDVVFCVKDSVPDVCGITKKIPVIGSKLCPKVG